MKGYRTLIFNGVIAAIAGVLTWALGIDWTSSVSPTVAMIIVAVANAGLRFITDTAVGKSM